ncbi:MAG TPA: hypothetical protein VFZ11_12825 [Gemmatimonadaceae bacterium]
MHRPALSVTVLMIVLATLPGCDSVTSPAAERDAPILPVHPARDRQVDAEACALGRDDFTLASTNEWLPIDVGSEWSYRGEEHGVPLELRITVLDETAVVGGVVVRVVEEHEREDAATVEVSRNFVAATDEGAVCYLGEDVDIYEDGEIVSHDGAWRADEPGNAPGILMPADPRPGMAFPMERAPGIAEDEGRIVGSGPVRTSAGTFTETLRVRESNPLDGDVGFKVYAKGVGLVIDGPVSLVSWRIGSAASRR